MLAGGDRLGQPFRPPDNRHQQAAVGDQPFGDAARVFQRHRVHFRIAAVEIAGVETLALQLLEMPGDLGRSVEAQRVGAGDELLGLVQFVLGRPLQSEA